MSKIRYLTKGELQEANRQALNGGGRAVAPEYIQGLPDNFRYPVFFTIPWERHGWVRCQVGTGASPAVDDYTPIVIDVPNAIYENLGVVEVSADEEVKQ
jgi:hypothetical protein